MSLNSSSQDGHSLIHYGTTASHVAARALIFGAPLPDGTILPKSGPATDQPATPNKFNAYSSVCARKSTRVHLASAWASNTLRARRGLRSSISSAWPPGAGPVYTHMRSAGRVEPGSAIESVEEVIGAAAITGAARISFTLTARACATHWNASL